MSSERTSGSWTDPTWRRLVGSTVVLFLVILAFLVGRARAGADPGLARETTRATTQSAPRTADPSAPGVDPTDPFGQTPSDPGTDPGPSGSGSGSGDNFGNAVPG